MSTYPLLYMETHARCQAFEFSRLDLREHREDEQATGHALVEACAPRTGAWL